MFQSSGSNAPHNALPHAKCLTSGPCSLRPFDNLQFKWPLMEAQKTLNAPGPTHAHPPLLPLEIIVDLVGNALVIRH